MNRMLIAIILTVLSAPLLANGEKSLVPAPLKSAMVYRSGAELVHTAHTQLQQGTNELVIEGISNQIDLNSLRIGTSRSITILSVEFSTNFLKPSTKSALIRRLEDSLERLNKELSRIQTVLKTNQDMLELLNSNKTIAGSQTGLDVTELTRMMDYYKTKTLEMHEEIALYRERETKNIEQHSRISRQIKEEEQKNSKTGGKILLQVYSPVSGSCSLTVSYVTPLAYWVPSYDLRVDGVNKPLQLSYKAKLVQTSGFDWKQVKLSLSTSAPAQHNNAPVLKTWFLAYQYPKKGGIMIRGAASLSSSNRLDEVVVTGISGRVAGLSVSDNKEETAPPIYVVDGNVVSASEFRRIEKWAIKETKTLKASEATAIYGSRAAGGAVVVTLKDDLGDYITVKDNQLNVVFDIDLPYDVPSNGKEQNVVLKDFSMPAIYNYFTAPHADPDAYLLGEIPEWESLNLLPGEANIIFEGTYIGKTKIDPNSTSDTLRLTLGRDKRVVVTREKLADFSSVKFLGSNKKQTYTYEITVKNNKKEKIQVILNDQFPISTHKDIEVDLLQHDGASIDAETGILTWKQDLNPGEVKKVRLSYSVKYPKDKKVNL